MKTLLLTLVLAACTKPAGGPLSHTFDNTKIAAVPLDQKSAVVEAQQQHDLALLRQKTASQSYRDSEIEEDAAELQADRAIVVSQVVAARQPDAKLAAANADTAALARKTAEGKVTFMHARREWLAKAADAALYAVYAAQARLEFERAKVAQTNHLAAADFNLEPFQKQLDAREQASKTAADAADALRKTAEAKLAAWVELERAYLAANGIKGTIESDHYAAEWKAAPAPPPAAPTPAAEPAKPETVPATPAPSP